MTEKSTTTPKEAKGGVISPLDAKLIKKLLLSELNNNNSTLTFHEQVQASNLVHRLGRIS